MATIKKQPMSEKEIEKLLKDRHPLLSSDIKKADEIEKEIKKDLMSGFDNYRVDFILETLTMFGEAPNVVYDDNGLFAVSSMGYQPVVCGKQRIEGLVSVYVKKNQWEKTIRLALKKYLFTPKK
jgi:hypothetical protein